MTQENILLPKKKKSILLRYIKSFEIENKATKIPNKKTSQKVWIDISFYIQDIDSAS